MSKTINYALALFILTLLLLIFTKQGFSQTRLPIKSSPTDNQADHIGLIKGNSKIINGLVFSIVQCTGDRKTQTITVTYTIGNPDKVNQTIYVGTYSYNITGFAMDANGNRLEISNVTLGAKTGRVVTSELPTGIMVKGTVKFNNALPTSAVLQYLSIPISSQNLRGGLDSQSVNVTERDIPVAWYN